tara:strand:- start:375 stop:632 length:258 start_codon:yes stop_codon:yes gene_type:complete
VLRHSAEISEAEISEAEISVEISWEMRISVREEETSISAEIYISKPRDRLPRDQLTPTLPLLGLPLYSLPLYGLPLYGLPLYPPG